MRVRIAAFIALSIITITAVTVTVVHPGGASTCPHGATCSSSKSKAIPSRPTTNLSDVAQYAETRGGLVAETQAYRCDVEEGVVLPEPDCGGYWHCTDINHHHEQPIVGHTLPDIPADRGAYQHDREPVDITSHGPHSPPD